MNVYFCIFQLTFLRHCLKSVFIIVKWCSIFWILHHHHSSQSLPSRIKPFESVFAIVKWCSIFWILHHHSSQSLPSREKPFFPVNFPISNKYSPLRLPTVYTGCMYSRVGGLLAKQHFLLAAGGFLFNSV